MVVALLPSLVERSIVVVDRRPDRGAHYRLLETLREYGRAQLDADESREAHRRHLEYYIDVAERAADGLQGPQQAEWLDRLGHERGAYLTESRAAYECLGLRWELVIVLGRLGQMARLQGDYEAARSHFEESLAVRTRIGDVGGRAWSQWQFGVLARYQGSYDEADALYRESMSLFEAIDDAPGVAHVRYSMGDVARLRGDDSLAGDLYTLSLAQLREHGDRRCVASTLMNLGHVAIHRGEVDDAAGLFAQSLGLRRDLGDQAGIAECLEAFPAVIEGHDQAGAVRLLGAAEALRDDDGRGPGFIRRPGPRREGGNAAG
jgi:tetratricopeptide (TPR) repeat protein